MSSRKLTAGVIGLGVGEQHLLQYCAIDGVKVGAIADLEPTRLAHVGDKYGIEKRHTDWRQITEDPDIDVVSICTYDDGHAEQAISALRHGKHVMVEKPVALHREEAAALCQAVQESGRLISSNLILRAEPRFREVKRMIGDGLFGDIFHVEGDYLHDILWKITEGWRGKMDFYCTFYGGGLHLVDLMRWLMGEEVTEVSAMGSSVLTRNSSYQYPDTITALLKFSGGATAKCTTTFGSQRTKFHALNVYGSKRTFINDMPDAKLFFGDDPADETAMTVAYPDVKKGDLLPDFVAAIREKRPPNVTDVDIFRVMEVCFAVWESVQTGRVVKPNYLI